MQVGLDQLYIAKITEAEGVETYSTPVHIASAIEANISPSVDTQNVFADDNVAEIISVFSSVEVSFTLADLGTENYQLLLGKEKDSNGVVIDTADDIAPFLALGFRSKKSNGEYRHVWLYKGRFEAVEESYQTQQDKADYQTQPVKGTFIKRADGKWRARVDSDDATIGATVIKDWFTKVYETPAAPILP